MAGCFVAEDDTEVADGAFDFEPVAPASTGDPDEPPVSHNPFDPGCFWSDGVQKTYRDLSKGALTSPQSLLPSMPHLSNTPNSCRKQALDYLVGCALPFGDSAIDPATGTAHAGRFGLAASWQTGAPDTTSKEWVTSCLAAHLNGYMTPTTLLLEGNHDGLYFNSQLQASYKKRESITWGNIFDTPPNDTPKVYVCHFDDLANACGASTTSAVNHRVCDDSPDCGLIPMGNCNTACSWPTSAGGSANGYWTCGSTNTSVRVRLQDFSRYSTDCSTP